MTPSNRIHGFDALRAFALLLGVWLHASLPYVLPPGAWVLGSATPNPLLGWLAFYIHSFRLEVFFLLAGWGAALVIERRGWRAFAAGRGRRILLVFVLALYPMKFTLALLWLRGNVSAALSYLATEKLSNIAITHLWFLYVLSLLTAVYLVLRLVKWPTAWLRPILASRLAPLYLAAAVLPLIGNMQGMDIDTPDRGILPHPPVFALYLLLFSLGAWLQTNPAVFDHFAARWRLFVTTGLALSFLTVIGVGLRYTNPASTELRWATAAGISLTMACSVFGWLGCFYTRFTEPSPAVRFVSQASYWVYVAHLPVVVGLQLLLHPAGLPWWVEVPLIAALTVALLLWLYSVRPKRRNPEIDTLREIPLPGPSHSRISVSTTTRCRSGYRPPEANIPPSASK